ncbi:MAG: histidine kinase [Bacteroidales bacterium]|nr:histidine kinase [Bacteroidales bacterium]
MIHPITDNRSRFTAWWLIWLTIGAVQSLLLHFLCDCTFSTAVTDGLSSALLLSLIAIAVWYPVTLLVPRNSGIIKAVSNHILIAAIALTLWILGVKLAVDLINGPSMVYDEFWNRWLLLRLGAGLFIYVVIVLSYHLMVSFDNITKKNIREASLEKTLRETELMALRSQINPHFLFNSLNSISSLTIDDPALAREMIIKLSDFMRYALSRKEQRFVPLLKELENMRLYLEIEKVRFGNRLVCREECEHGTHALLIPNMILQPLYENAVKHGVYESTEKVEVLVFCYLKEAVLTIKIENNFDPGMISRRGTGTGLENVRERLRLAYSGMASLQTSSEQGRFTVTLIIPALSSQDN